MARAMFVISYAMTYVLIILTLCIIFGVDTDGWPYYAAAAFVATLPAGALTWRLRQKRNKS